MKLDKFVETMNSLAPQSLALDYDNVGLLVGPDRDEITSVLVSLDCTPVTAREAVDAGADLLLTHHPIFFHGIKRFLPDDPETAAAYILARNGVGHFAAHTNLDAALNGVNDALAAALGLSSTEVFGPEGICRIGESALTATLDGFARFVAQKLDAAVRVTGSGSTPVRRVAVCGGACTIEDIRLAKTQGADVFVTGEIRHHEALAAQAIGMSVVEAGHYETERTVLPLLIKRLQELCPGVQYTLTHRETSCLRGI